MKKIVLAGGCFWGVEEYYRRLKGVDSTKVGYAQGSNENPTYMEVCDGTFNHAEVVEVNYDENVISLEKLLEHLFRIIDPTSLNKQGADIGVQYRTGVYYEDINDKEVIEAYIDSRKIDFEDEIVIEVQELDKFFDAELYHQQYLVKNPTGYCHVNMSLINHDELKDIYK